MACSKYTLTNTGSSISNFSYRRCDDNMWEYQVELDPNQTKNIWLINNTYFTAFSNVIVKVNDGAFPPLNATATPTPTPTTTQTNTPTPSVTATQTPTPSVTATQTSTPTASETSTPTPTASETSTPTPTASQTPTPTVTTTTTLTATQTPTLTQTPTHTPTPFNYSFALGSGDTQNAACAASTTSLYTTRSQGPTIEVTDFLYVDALTTIPAPNGYYSNGTTWYRVTGGLGEVTTKDDNGCLSLVTPTPTVTSTVTSTPTPSVTATHTPTPSITPSATPIARYIHAALCHSETSAEDACGCTGNATIWSNNIQLSASTLFWSDSTGVNTGNPDGWYALDNIVYYVNNDCGIGCSTGSTLGYSSICNVTPTPTPTQTNTPTLTSTPIQSPTPTQSGTPAVTPTPTPSGFGTNTFKVTMVNTGRAIFNNYTLTQIPYVVTPGVGFTGTTGSYPVSATTGSSVTNYGNHSSFSSGNVVTFTVSSTGSDSATIFLTVNGSTTTSNVYSIATGANILTWTLSSSYSSSDTFEFKIQ